MAYEDKLLNMQASNLRRQRSRLQDLEPFTLESLGITRDPVTGKLIRMAGTDTIDPFLARFKTDQENRLLGTYKSPQMENALFSYSTKLPTTGTSGNQARAIYDTNAGILREGINRGGLESGANLLSQREGLVSNLAARKTEDYKNLNASDLRLLSGIQNALGPYQSIREQQFASDMQEKQNRATKRAGQYQLAGSVIGLIAAIIAS